MSLKELECLINALQERLNYMPVSSSMFKAGMIVNRRLMKALKQFKSVYRLQDGGVYGVCR